MNELYFKILSILVILTGGLTIGSDIEVIDIVERIASPYRTKERANRPSDLHIPGPEREYKSHDVRTQITQEPNWHLESIRELGLPEELVKLLDLKNPRSFRNNYEALRAFAVESKSERSISSLLSSITWAYETLRRNGVNQTDLDDALSNWIDKNSRLEVAQQWLKLNRKSTQELVALAKSNSELGWVIREILNDRWKTFIQLFRESAKEEIPDKLASYALYDFLAKSEDYLKLREDWVRSNGYKNEKKDFRMKKRVELIRQAESLETYISFQFNDKLREVFRKNRTLLLSVAPLESKEMVKRVLALHSEPGSRWRLLPRGDEFKVKSEVIPVTGDGKLSTNFFLYKFDGKEAVLNPIPEHLKKRTGMIIAAGTIDDNGALESHYKWAKENGVSMIVINSMKELRGAAEVFKKAGKDRLYITGHAEPQMGMRLTNRFSQKVEHLNIDSIEFAAESLAGYQCIFLWGCNMANHCGFNSKLSLYTGAEVWTNDHELSCSPRGALGLFGAADPDSYWHVTHPKSSKIRLINDLNPTPTNKPVPILGPAIFIRPGEPGA